MPTALPPPSSNDGDPSRSQRTRERHRKGSAIPSAEEILAMLVRLNGLVALKLISTAQATVIQRNLRTILDYHVRQVQGGQPGLPQAALALPRQTGTGGTAGPPASSVGGALSRGSAHPQLA
jgi:hypothetical protein